MISSLMNGSGNNIIIDLYNSELEKILIDDFICNDGSDA